MKNPSNHKFGNLLIFEGPDGIGKTTLANALTETLNAKGLPYNYYSFPGKEPKTLGSLVYQLHHDSLRFGIEKISADSLQLLHVAAHLDAISSKILPVLSSGHNVILDRYWWSTVVYGITNGIDKAVLTAMIEVENRVWNGVKPTAVFHLQAKKPFIGKATPYWQKLSKNYLQLSQKESLKYKVIDIKQKGSLSETLTILLQQLESMSLINSKRRKNNLMRNTKKEILTGLNVFTKLSPLKTTIVYDTYWRFTSERQNIFFKKMTTSLSPWTKDKILQQYKFTNAYRASDRVSQYLIRNVINNSNSSPNEVVFRILLFKIFNKIATWELLLEKLGNVTYSSFSFKQYDDILSSAIAKGHSIYSAAYIMPSGGKGLKFSKKHRMHLSLLDKMMKDDIASKIIDSSSMREAFEILRSYPSIGDFLAYQYVTDLNYSPLLNFSEMDFVVAGPGAKDGIRKCFSDFGGLSETEIIKIVADRQIEEFARLGLDFKSLWGRKLQLIDCQNLFCEVDKYARLKHPEYQGLTGRTRIKQKYHWNPIPIDYYYPPKWGINDKIRNTK